MTMSPNWSWWTYFVVDGTTVTRKQIVSYDLRNQSITYLRRNANDPKQNPHPIGSPEYDAWFWDKTTSRFDAIWVDPEQSMTLDVDAFNQLANGQRPESFKELIGQDPQAYFSDEYNTLSAYLSPELVAHIRNKKPEGKGP
jgi:hypothetical protein